MRLPAALHVPVAALATGLAAGALAGGLDGLYAALSARTLGVHATALCVALGVAIGGPAGALLAALARGLAAGARRVLRLRPDRAVAVATAVLAAPLIGLDAFAMFTGARAQRIPGHHALSIGLVLLGLLVTALAAAAFTRALTAATAGGPNRQRARLWVRATVVVSGLALLALPIANAWVLPRLYLWLHASLYAASFVAAALLLVGAGALWPRPRPSWLAWLAPALATAAALWALPALATRSDFRFVMLGRSPGTQFLLRHLPLPRPRWVRAGGGAPGTAAADPQAGPLAPGPRRPSADVVVITIDALRADHVGAYGYARPTTPNLDRLAREGVLFRRAYAQAPHTSFSIASLLTGKYYPTVTRLGEGHADEAVPEVLRRYGWRTGAFYPPAVFFVDGDKLAAFRDSHFQFEYVKCEFLDAHDRLEQIRTYFDVVKPERAFLWLHLFEPHEPYDPHEGHGFGSADLDRYDGEIAYTDAAVGRLLDYLDRERPGAIVIVTADHGEEFDEHGGRYHGTSLYDEQIRVPFIVRVPGVRPHVVEGPVELVDIAPTVLALLDIPIPARMRGDDLGPWLRDPPAPDERLRPAFAELDQLRMVATAGDKLICRLDDESCELFDLRRNPAETSNLVDVHPARVAALRGRLDGWLAEQAALEPVRTLAGATTAQVPIAIEKGRLGDVTAADELLALVRSRATPAPVRLLAAETLATLPPPGYLRGRLEHALAGFAGERQVGDWLAVAAAAVGVPRAVEQVAGLLARARAPEPAAADAGASGGADLALQAALALAGVEDPRAGPALTAALASKDCGAAGSCRRVVLALGRLRDTRAVPALLGALPDVMIRREVVEALGQIGDPAALPALQQHLLEDEYVPVRAEAARALSRLGGRAAVATLRKASRRERERQVGAAIAEALAALSPVKRVPSRPAPSPGKSR